MTLGRIGAAHAFIEGGTAGRDLPKEATRKNAVWLKYRDGASTPIEWTCM